MRVLDIAPPAQWWDFSDELKFEIRKLTIRERVDLVEGTALAAIWTKDQDTLDVPRRDFLEVAERVVDRMVTDWTVQDREGVRVPVSVAAARWLMTEEPDLTNWLVTEVYLQGARREAEVEEEKKD